MDVLPIEDSDHAHPVPSAWRPVIEDIVRAFMKGDFRLAEGIEGVPAPDAETAAQIEDYLGAYGETLVALSAGCWETSISQWQQTHWEVLVDLWTEESGDSDLVLHMSVYKSGPGFSFRVDSVHVP